MINSVKLILTMLIEKLITEIVKFHFINNYSYYI